MLLTKFRELGSIGKGSLFAVAPLRLLMDMSPVTLNPRAAQDAAGQRIGALVYSALTRIDENLEAQGDLARSWEQSQDGKSWKFTLRADAMDHGGRPITVADFAACLENYRTGKPVAPIRAGLFWKSTSVESNAVVIALEKPDPYLPRNLSLFRYFRQEGKTPCEEPDTTRPWFGSGIYEPHVWMTDGLSELRLTPRRQGYEPVTLLFVKDEGTRLLKLLNREADGVQNGLSLTKTRWLQKNHASQFSVIERDGVNVGYLAFNLKDPILSHAGVRKAISRAIDRDSILKHKFFGFGHKAGSFLSPGLAESEQTEIPFDRASAEQLLDQAGYPRKASGFRFKLTYKTTPVREGLETALLIREDLRRVGIDIQLDVVDPGVFLASVRKGGYQLYSSRWVGVADGSILYRTLRSGQPNNRAGYKDAQVDQWLDAALAERDLARRKPLLAQVQAKMAEDLPYFPLWHWKNALVLRKELEPPRADSLSMSGALEPLFRALKGNSK